MSTQTIYPGELYNVLVNVGLTWQLQISYKDDTGTPIDLTGYQAKMQARVNEYTDPPILDISDGNGITLNNPSTGDIWIEQSDAQTALLSPGTYEYDLILTDTAGNKLKLVRGAFTVKQPVTQ